MRTGTDTGASPVEDPVVGVGSLGRIEALVFDVVGTLVDEVGSLRREMCEAFAAHGLDEGPAQSVADHWRARCHEEFSAVADGRRDWAPETRLRRELLPGALAAHGLELPDAALDRLGHAGGRLTPWPEVPEQLGVLAARVLVTALSNADLARIAEISARGGLCWHAVLSTELAHTFKPAPAAYRLPTGLLGLDPRRTLFVSAHPWDLRGAAAHGYRTALLPRTHAEAPRPGRGPDLTLGSLDELALVLAP
ncbi:haloacid dehalogenase type II [Streptomyces sp. NPDC049954]|uniref:haloacid dehalogenase type II n=1 Tax=Streptomyces sp. NPDC049954 TaxID=3155779 RepID=UPI00341A139E